MRKIKSNLIVETETGGFTWEWFIQQKVNRMGFQILSLVKYWYNEQGNNFVVSIRVVYLACTSYQTVVSQFFS